jgi:ankyrin repeat protein
MKATALGKFNLVQYLVKKGADIQVRSDQGNSKFIIFFIFIGKNCIDFALEFGQSEIANYLKSCIQ